MTTIKILGAAIALTAFVALPASAQEAISEPGNFAFFRPNADVLNGGRTAPSAAFASIRADTLAVQQPAGRRWHWVKRYY